MESKYANQGVIHPFKNSFICEKLFELLQPELHSESKVPLRIAIGFNGRPRIKRI